MNRFKCLACDRNQYTACATVERCIYCGNKELKKMEALQKNEVIKIKESEVEEG